MHESLVIEKRDTHATCSAEVDGVSIMRVSKQKSLNACANLSVGRMLPELNRTQTLRVWARSRRINFVMVIVRFSRRENSDKAGHQPSVRIIGPPLRIFIGFNALFNAYVKLTMK